jgi:hypothetical protein
MNNDFVLLWITRIWLGLALALCAVSIYGHMLIGLDSDTLMLTHQADLWLHGAVPYVDYTDVDPPLCHLIFIPAVLLAKVTDMPLYVALAVFTSVLVLLVLMLVETMLRYSGVAQRRRLVVASALGLALLTVSFINQAFGDREHLLVTLMTPFLVLYSPLAERGAIPKRLRMLAAVMAGIGFAIKPYSYGFYLAAVGSALMFGRPLRALLREPEHYVIAGIAVLYLVCVWLFFREYLVQVLPVGLETYRVFSWQWPDKLGAIEKDMLGGYGLTGILAAMTLWFWVPAHYERGIVYIVLLMVAGIVSYAASGGWYYAQYPFMAMAFVLAVAAGGKLVWEGTERKQLFTTLVLSALVAGGLGYYYGQPVAWRSYWDMTQQAQRGQPLSNLLPNGRAMARINAHLRSHPAFLLLSLDLWGANLLREGSDREPLGRFDYLWPLPGILQLENHPEKRKVYDSLVDYLTRSVAEDLQRHTPQMVIVDVSPYKRLLPLSYDMLAFFNKDPRFAAQWEQYNLADKLNSCTPDAQAMCAYEFYYRR